MKTGYWDAGIHLRDGKWARLQDVAEVLSKSKPQFEGTTANDLREMLEKTDEAGRFEINDQGDVCKVERDYRITRTRTGTESNNETSNHWANSKGSASHRTRRTNYQPKNQQDEPDMTARVQSPDPAEERPAPPPGENWKKFVDDGHEWWYYEGPLGKWYVPEPGKDPEPYPDEDDEE